MGSCCDYDHSFLNSILPRHFPLENNVIHNLSDIIQELTAVRALIFAGVYELALQPAYGTSAERLRH